MHADAPTEELIAREAMWAHMRREAEEALRLDPSLTPLMRGAILNRASLEEAVVHRVAARLGASAVDAETIADAFLQAVRDDATIAAAFRADLAAYVERDPACGRMIEPLLYFKGFHAIQSARLAHRTRVAPRLVKRSLAGCSRSSGWSR